MNVLYAQFKDLVISSLVKYVFRCLDLAPVSFDYTIH